MKSNFHDENGILKKDINMDIIKFFNDVKKTGSGLFMCYSFEEGELKENLIAGTNTNYQLIISTLLATIFLYGHKNNYDKEETRELLLNLIKNI